MGYDNPIFKFAEKRPILAFFVVPVFMQLAGSGLYYVIRTIKTGSPLQGGVGAGEEDEENPLSALGAAPGRAIRKQGGDASDLVFRATTNPRSTGPGTGLWDTVMPSPTQQPVRYDLNYHHEHWLPDPNETKHIRALNQHGVVNNESI